MNKSSTINIISQIKKVPTLGNADRKGEGARAYRLAMAKKARRLHNKSVGKYSLEGGGELAVSGSTGAMGSDSSPVPSREYAGSGAGSRSSPVPSREYAGSGAGSRSLPGVPVGGRGRTASGEADGLTVREADGLSGGFQGGLCLPCYGWGKGWTKRTRIAKLARRWAWLKSVGSYLDYMPYYFSALPESLKSKLEWCQHTWIKECKGEDVRWRGIGCGERKVCPVCGSYRQVVLAREASEGMLLAQTGVEIGFGVRPESYGLKLVLTIPKTESVRMDSLLLVDYSAWIKEVGWLFKAAYAFIGRWFGDGCGGVISLDYAGESAPADAHYHLNVYVFPVRCEGSNWASLGRWIDKKRLEEMRDGWTSVVNEMYGLHLKKANFKAFYLGSVGQLHHWMRYLYRHVFSDLWRGWQGVEGGQVKYGVGKRGEEQFLSGDDIQRMADRQRLIPAHFKRIRWFGIFSDGQRTKTMESLGLEAVEMADKDDENGEGWEREGEPARFVRYVADGVMLRTDGGGEFFVPDKFIDYRPGGVSIGKRKRWREPGGFGR